MNSKYNKGEAAVLAKRTLTDTKPAAETKAAETKPAAETKAAETKPVATAGTKPAATKKEQAKPNTVKPTAKANERRLLINGNGFGGIAVGFLFFTCAMIGFYVTMSLFVNTKHLTNPLLLGKVEY